MPRAVTPALSPGEWSSLKELSHGSPRIAVARELVNRLMYFGYITDSRGVLALTTHGQDRLRQELGQELRQELRQERLAA